MKKNVKLLIIIAAAAVVLVGVMLLLIFLPKSGDNADPMDSIDPGIDMSTSVDGNGMHQATIKTNDKGEIENNSYGTLIDYVPAKISTINVENTSGTLDIKSETRIVTSLDFVGIEPLDARMRGGGAHLTRHDHPKRSVLLSRRAHRQAQPHALVAHHQARPIAHASETLGNKSGDILLERRVTHSRDYNATAPVDCQRRCSGCGQCLDQNLQLDIAVHGSPRLQPQPLSVAWHLKCFKIER